MAHPHSTLSRMNRAHLTFALSAVLMISSLAAVHADSLRADQVKPLVESGEILALDEILRRNEARINGRIIEIELEQKRGAYVYEIKVLRSNGRYQELKIDARTGVLTREE